MSVEPVVEISGLQKTFGQVHALKDITFNVNPGEVFGFIGPNGAGKSTTIRILLGILKASGGSAKILGHDVWKDASKIHQQIAYVPGDVYLWPELTGGEIIDLFLRMHGQKHNQQTDELIKAFELDISKKSRDYSKGNRQKVALVIAFSLDAKLYIFDEPTSGLDPLMEQVFQTQVAALKKRGKSILLSSHILEEVERMGDRIGIIRAGEMIEVGSLKKLQQFSRTQIEVYTTRPLTNLKTQGGIHQLTTKQVGKQYQSKLSVDHDQLGVVMNSLASCQITQLQVAPPTLDDIFLHYYNQSEGSMRNETI